MKFINVITNYIRRSLMTTLGDIIIRGATGPERLGSGGANLILTSAGAGTALSWGNNSSFYAVGGPNFRVKILDIGVWDMDATDFLDIAHGLTLANIIFVGGYIQNDLADGHYFFVQNEYATGGQMDLFIDRGQIANIRIRRRNGGYFDSILFDDGVIDRGKLYVVYIV